MISIIGEHKKHCFKKFKSYNCTDCDFKAEGAKILSSHRRVGCFSHICSRCDFKTSIMKELHIHKEKNHSITSYVCQNCDYIVKTKGYGVQMTMKAKHETTGCFRYSCLSCDYKTSIPNTMGAHRARVHARRENDTFYDQFKKSMAEVFSV